MEKGSRLKFNIAGPGGNGPPPQLVADLKRSGLLISEDCEGGEALRFADENLFLFLPMLTSFDVRLVPVSKEGCPVRFCTAILKSISDQPQPQEKLINPIPAGGQGRTPIAAAFGCLGELAERLSLCTLGESDPRIFSKNDLQPEVGLDRILGLSEAQVQKIWRKTNWETGRLRGGENDWEQMTTRRVKVQHLGGADCAYMPSLGVLFHEIEQIAGTDFSFASSAGCAVWRTMEGARERALLELVERDAVAQAWYNRLGITALPVEILNDVLPVSLNGFLEKSARSRQLYKVATDLDVHVVLAVSFEKDGKGASFGASAGWNIASACEGAVQEMLQSEFSLELMARAYPLGDGMDRTNDPIPRQLIYAREKSILNDLPLNDVATVREAELARSYSYGRLLQSCLDREIDIWEFNATRPDLNIPCVKLFSPELCSWEPRFGKKRLYDGVVQRGLRRTVAREAEFAARPFPF
ncbi:bacteriocin biosynthesis docking scaffold, SagD family [Roseibium album]|nr:bacteriocin biosynthesis docking scaffold, SagD family [Roseibium album]